MRRWQRDMMREVATAKYIALPVAAAAYPQGYLGTQLAKTHIVDVEQDYAPLCSRVKPGSILRDTALAGPASSATCQACQSQYRTEQERGH